MTRRTTRTASHFLALASGLAFLASCGSAPVAQQQPVVDDSAVASAVDQVPVAVEDTVFEEVAPVWTGAFQETAVMLSDTVHIEGPAGLLDHVIASSDDNLFERSVQTTSEGFMQVIGRTGVDVPEIRVQLDAWTIAAFQRVVILERVDECPVTVIASGEVLWRDPNGLLAQGSRLEFEGTMGDDTAVVPESAVAAQREETDSAEGAEVSAAQDQDTAANPSANEKNAAETNTDAETDNQPAVDGAEHAAPLQVPAADSVEAPVAAPASTVDGPSSPADGASSNDQ